MIYVLGIVGSPRVGGNTERLVSETLKASEEEGARTELLRLADKKIEPCDGCRLCKKAGKCWKDDDFKVIYDKMAQADGIILSSPVYFGSATPQVKALIDRAGYLSSQMGRIFESKVGGALVVARRAGHNFTFAQLLFFFLNQGMIIPGSTYWNIAFGREKDEVSKDEEGMQTARNFGKRMVWLIKKIKNID
ncbi:MAG: flavodoxin family protein [Nitrososphaeria archaeon]